MELFQNFDQNSSVKILNSPKIASASRKVEAVGKERKEKDKNM